MVREVLLEVCGLHEAQHGLEWEAGKHNIVLYAYGGYIKGRKPIWVQKTLPALVLMFEIFRLKANLGKTKAMVCNPRFIWLQQREEECKRRETGKGYTLRKRKWKRVSGEVCGETMVS